MGEGNPQDCSAVLKMLYYAPGISSHKTGGGGYAGGKAARIPPTFPYCLNRYTWYSIGQRFLQIAYGTIDNTQEA